MTSQATVALVTCATLPELDPDDQLLLQPLRSLGIDAIAAAWDDSTIDWAPIGLAVVRSTWDYTTRRHEFVAWARSVPRLANPADVIQWNTDKRYLADLAQAGIPVVPTSWLEPTDAVVLPSRGRHVLKPSVGAGSLDAAAFSLHDEHELALAKSHAARLMAAGQSVMVQPYVEQIEKLGETSLIFVGGEFSHAVNKSAMLVGDRDREAGGLYLRETIEARQPTQPELDLARMTLAAVPGGSEHLTYARVDVVPDASGKPILMELELTEPSLYLAHAAGAAERFARVLAQRAAAIRFS